MDLKLVPANSILISSFPESRIRVQQEREAAITTTVLNILKRNPNIQDTDLGSIVRANFPVGYYNRVSIQVCQESYEFPEGSKPQNARVITITPIDASRGQLSSLYTALFLGTKFENYIYNGSAMEQCIRGLEGAEEGFEECAKALEEKRPIIIRVAGDYVHCAVASDSPPLCTIS